MDFISGMENISDLILSIKIPILGLVRMKEKG